MANVTTKNPVVIDTIGTGVDLPDVRNIKAIVWVGTEGDAIAANDDLVIRHHVTDGSSAGDIIIDKRATAATDGLNLTFGGDVAFMAPDGIFIGAMDGGVLYIFTA